MNDAKMLKALTEVVNAFAIRCNHIIAATAPSSRLALMFQDVGYAQVETLGRIRRILAEPEPAAAKQEAPIKQFTVVFATGQSYVEAWYVMATDSDDARQKVPVPVNSPRPFVFPGHISPL